MAFNLNQTKYFWEIADISTASQIYVPIFDDGEIIEFASALNGAIATADANLTMKIGGTAVTNGVITVAFTGSTYGDVDIVSPSAAHFVCNGDAVEIETDGASTNTISVRGYFVVQR